jgi:hypothetical protein
MEADMNYDQRLQRSAKVQRIAIGWAVGLAFLAGIILLATLHGKGHHHISKTALWAIAIPSIGAIGSYGIVRLADSRIAWLADRAFLTRLYMGSGFPRREAQRLAHRKINRGG